MNLNNINMVIKITRKGLPVYVRLVSVGELDKLKFSHKFVKHGFPDTHQVYVKCFPDGTFDLRGKKNQYRILLPDNIKNDE
jgi:hypothetical protein